jgi:hypothetical protein
MDKNKNKINIMALRKEYTNQELDIIADFWIIKLANYTRTGSFSNDLKIIMAVYKSREQFNAGKTELGRIPLHFNVYEDNLSMTKLYELVKTDSYFCDAVDDLPTEVIVDNTEII